jgi:DNA-directed RNA polymerase specialized sigma24 family protein
MNRAEKKIEFDRWLSRLSNEDKCVVLLYEHLYTYEEIGYIMGWSTSKSGNKIRALIDGYKEFM